MPVQGLIGGIVVAGNGPLRAPMTIIRLATPEPRTVRAELAPLAAIKPIDAVNSTTAKAALAVSRFLIAGA
jgi:hypothetical protein